MKEKFNRGATLNIGYLYYNNPLYSYITHDVDVNPIDDIIIKTYAKSVLCNNILAIYSDSRTLGGIIKMKGETFKKINGFPNDYWGWGHEDKDILNRAEFYNCNISRNIGFHDNNKNSKLKIFNDNHIRQDSNKWAQAYVLWNKLSNNEQEEYIKGNGLSTLKYDILSEQEIMTGVKKITVNF